MYDKFNKSHENGAPSVYGFEYEYKNPNGKSSGVASNEPTIGNESSPLIELLSYRYPQTQYETSINGKDKDQFFSPLGENFLPSASITYSRVLKRSLPIYNAGYNATSSGFTVYNYFTSKDFPQDKDYGINIGFKPLKGFSFTKQYKEEYVEPVFPNPFTTIDRTNFLGNQSYHIIKTKFDGIPKSVFTYSGDYNDPSTWSISNFVKYNYLMPGESVPLFMGFNYNKSLGDPLLFECGVPGIDIETVIENKKIIEKLTNSLQQHWDIDLIASLGIPFPLPTVSPHYTDISKVLETNVASNLYTFPVIVKSIETLDDGQYQKIENVAYDHKTGNPIIKSSNDEFDNVSIQNQTHIGTYYNYSFPTSYNYNSFNKQSRLLELKNVEFNLEENVLTLVSGSLNYPLNEYFTKGDKVIIFNTNIQSEQNIKLVEDVNSTEIILHKTIIDLDLEKYIKKPLKVEVLNSNLNNRSTASSDVISTYSNSPSISFCDNLIPNEFTHVNQIYFGEFSNKMNDLKNTLNSQISNEITMGNFSPLLVDFSGIDLEIQDLLNGPEAISDTSKFQFKVYFDSTVNITYPLDSIKLTLEYNNKNQLKQNPNIITNHNLVDNLNFALNDIWIMNLNTQIEDFTLFEQCSSNDSLNQYYSNYYMGKLDSNNYRKVVSYSNLYNLNNDSYLVYNLDSLNNIYKKGYQLLNDSNNTYLFNSYRDLDSLNQLGENRHSSLSYYSTTFVNDTNANQFQLELLKYFKPDCNSSDSIVCFKQDCRDTLLLSIDEIKNNWDTSLIKFPSSKYDPYYLYFPNNDSLISFVNSFPVFTEYFGKFELDSNGYLNYHTFNNSNGYNKDSIYQILKLLEIDTNLLASHISTQELILNPLTSSNIFTIDTNSNFQLGYDNSLISFGNKLVFPPQITTTLYPSYYKVNFKLENVINASTITYKAPNVNIVPIPPPDEYLLQDVLDKHILNSNFFAEKFIENKYYFNKKRNYPTLQSYASTGVIDEFLMFNHHTSIINNPNWINISENTVVDNEGKVYENKNINNVKSSIIYDNLDRPQVVSTNSGFEDIYFNDFELDEGSIENVYSEQFSHTGNKSIEIESRFPPSSPITPEQSFIVDSIKVSENYVQQGAIMRFWAKIKVDEYCENGAFSLDYYFNNDAPTQYIGALTPITKTGEWYMFEVQFPSYLFSGKTISDVISFQITNILNTCLSVPVQATIFLDDVIVKPINSSSNCYVYDISRFRIAATLDNNHFASILQYNEKGQVVRNIIETYRGYKTVTESQFNTPRIDRPQSESSQQESINTKVNNYNTNLRIGASDLLEFERSKPKDQEIKSKFNLLEFKLSQDSTNIKFFKFDHDTNLDTLSNTKSILDNKLNQKKSLNKSIMNDKLIQSLPNDSTNINIPNIQIIDSLNREHLIDSSTIDKKIKFNSGK